jgi:hypothetical protein
MDANLATDCRIAASSYASVRASAARHFGRRSFGYLRDIFVGGTVKIGALNATL